MADDIVLVAARRTPIGALNGALAGMSAHSLGAVAIAAALADAGLSGSEVDEVVMGQVLTAAAGMNPARQAARKAGIGDRAPAMTVNQVCGSGLRAVALGAQQIALGTARIVVAGGQESMSNAPHATMVRRGKKLGPLTLVDTAMHDGLTDAFYGYPMGRTAETVAERHGITRDEQDRFALASQLKAAAAMRENRFASEMVPVGVPGRTGATEVAADEHPRPDTDLDALTRLKPAFHDGGTVTAGNASGINDGAAAVALMPATEAESRGIPALARIASWAQAGLDPAVMGLGPIPASRTALDRAGWGTEDVDLWEINEAFAAQSIAVVRELALVPERVNVNGGAIALGHPIGASGTRVLVTLVHAMEHRNAARGVATLCIGGGMGIAMCVERR